MAGSLQIERIMLDRTPDGLLLAEVSRPHLRFTLTADDVATSIVLPMGERSGLHDWLEQVGLAPTIEPYHVRLVEGFGRAEKETDDGK